MMKYSLMLRSRPLLEQPVKAKHEEFFFAVSQMENPWGFRSSEYPPPPDIGYELAVEVALGKYLKKGISGELRYSFRYAEAEDRAFHDDYFTLEFDPRKQEYSSLVYDAFPEYIKAFRAYRGHIMDDEFFYIDVERKRQSNDRSDVYRVFPVAYYDEQLCLRAFGLSPEQILNKLRDRIEHVELISQGVYTVADSGVVSFEESKEVDSRIKSLINR